MDDNLRAFVVVLALDPKRPLILVSHAQDLGSLGAEEWTDPSLEPGSHTHAAVCEPPLPGSPSTHASIDEWCAFAQSIRPAFTPDPPFDEIPPLGALATLLSIAPALACFPLAQPTPLSVPAFLALAATPPSPLQHRLGLAEALPVPGLMVGHEGDWVVVAPGALPLWEQLALEPYGGRRDVAYIALVPSSLAMVEATAELLRGVTCAYDAGNLGTHSPSPLSQRGILEIPARLRNRGN